MNILLTGSSGNLGSHILRRANGHVYGISKSNLHALDDFVSKSDVVVHSAYDLKNSISECPEKFFNSNVLLTMRLLESMKKNNVGRLYFVSSCAVYGNSTNMSEDSVCAPVTINGFVKHLNEVAIEKFCLDNNIRYTFLRVFNMYAGNDNFSVLYKLYRSAHYNEPFFLNNEGVSQRDFIHVDDVARVVLNLIDIDPNETRINIGTGKTTKIFDLFQSVKNNNPEMCVVCTNKFEVEYARADISLLRKYISREFLDVVDFACNI